MVDPPSRVLAQSTATFGPALRDYPPRMEFKVIKDTYGRHDYYEGDDEFSIEAYGVLLVTLAGSRRRVFYSPAGWLRIEAAPIAEEKDSGEMLVT
jgi:hypothetical protein